MHIRSESGEGREEVMRRLISDREQKRKGERKVLRKKRGMKNHRCKKAERGKGSRREEITEQKKGKAEWRRKA